MTPLLFLAEHAQLLAVVVAVLALVGATYYQVRRMHETGSGMIPATWCSWTVVNVASFMAQKQAGSSWVQLGVPAIQLGSTLFLLAATCYSMRRHNSTAYKPGWVDFAVLGTCTAGVLCWMTWQNPYVIIGANVVANLAGWLPMYVQARASPRDVALKYWALRGTSTLAASFAFIGPGQVNLAGLIPTLTSVFIAGSILEVVLRRKGSIRLPALFGQRRPALA